MRVLVIGERFPDSFADNLAGSLEDAGHAVRCIGPFKRDRPTGWLRPRFYTELAAVPDLTARLQRHLLYAAEEHRPDLVVTLDYRVSHRVVGELRKVANGPVVLWYPDSPGTVGRETYVLAGYDWLFLKDSSTVRRYRDGLGLRSSFLPEACNPRWHRPPPEATPISSGRVLIAGNMNATRFKLVEALLARDLQVEVFGPPWARWLPDVPSVKRCWTGQYLARESKAAAFRSASVVLNPLASHEADGMNCRLFEAAACGAAVLTERRGRLSEFFSEEGEVLAYSSLDELVDKAKGMVAFDSGSRVRLGDAASARAHNEHTYLHRFSSICEALGSG